MKSAFLLSVAAMFLTTGVVAQESEPDLRFGLMADIQYADADAAGSRYYRNSLAKLDECVEALNREQVAFTVNLGDIVDRDTSDLDPVLERLKGLAGGVFNIAGNHDRHATTDSRTLYRRLGMPSAYYSFTQNGWVFIMLDTNEVSEYAWPMTAKKERKIAAMYDALRARSGREGASYNGGVGRGQLRWLRSELAKAQRKGQKALVFSHHPLWPDSGLSALNNADILDVIDDHNCVKAIFGGHHHAGGLAYRGDIPVVTVEGMVETPGENAFAVVELYDDRIVVKGRERTPSREFEFDSK